MFCPNCGKQLPDGSAFCDNCGAQVTAQSAGPEVLHQGEPVSPAQDPASAIAAAEPKACKGIELGADGKYRWVYELNMFKNPMILFTVWQIFLFAILICFVLLFAIIFISTIDWEDLFYIDFKPNYLYWNNLWDDIKSILFGFGIVGLGATFILGTIGYLILAIVMGGKEVMVFEMDNEGVNMMLQEKTYEKQTGLMWLVAVSAMTGKNSNAMLDYALLTKRSQYSSFSHSTTIIKKKAFRAIHLKQWFGFNTVYVEPEDFDFVWNYIVERVPGKCRIGMKKKNKM